jgi:hypothetical protein
VEVLAVDRDAEVLLDDRGGLLAPALGDQPARRLGQPVPYEQTDHGGYGARRKGDVPAVRPLGVDDVADEVRHDVADVPQDFEDAQIVAAPRAGRELGEQRGADRVVGADRQAHHQAEEENLPGSVDEEHQHGAGEEDREIDGEHRPAAEPVGDVSEEEAAEERADQGR